LFFGGDITGVLRFFGVIPDYTPEEKARFAREEKEKKDRYDSAYFSRRIIHGEDHITADKKAKDGNFFF